MGKDNEIYVNVSPLAVDKKNVEVAYQKTMPKIVEKLICDALAKAKSKGVTTKKPSGKDYKGFQLSPTLKLLKNIGKGKELKIRAEVSVNLGETKGDKIVAKVIIITEGATVTPGSPPPKNLDGDYQFAVESATKTAMQKAVKKILGK